MYQLLVQLADMLGLRSKPAEVGGDRKLKQIIEEKTKLNYCYGFLIHKKTELIHQAKTTNLKEEKRRCAIRLRSVNKALHSNRTLLENVDTIIDNYVFSQVATSTTKAMKTAVRQIDSEGLLSQITETRNQVEDMVENIDEISTVFSATDKDENIEEELLLLLEESQDDKAYIRSTSTIPSAADHVPTSGQHNLFRDVRADSGGSCLDSTNKTLTAV